MAAAPIETLPEPAPQSHHIVPQAWEHVFAPATEDSEVPLCRICFEPSSKEVQKSASASPPDACWE
ncbi:MAG: hypothetical protein ACPIOQ_26755 [Promethearchaeia archaeon]